MPEIEGRGQCGAHPHQSMVMLVDASIISWLPNISTSAAATISYVLSEAALHGPEHYKYWPCTLTEHH